MLYVAGAAGTFSLRSCAAVGGGAGEVDVAVSGPEGLDRSVRYPCAAVIWGGAGVRLPGREAWAVRVLLNQPLSIVTITAG